MRIVFFGTPAFAVPALTALLHSDEEVIAVVTQPDKRKGRDRLPAASPVKELALQNNSTVLQPSTLKDPLFHEEISIMKPEIIIVVAYGKILPPGILKLPPRGCINVHASLLPKYRGAAPVQWAIINGERKTGITTMYMDEGLDTGDILLQEETVIEDDATAESLGRRLADLGAALLMKTIQKIKDCSLQRIPQTGTPNYAPPFKKEDGKIPWSKTAVEISNMVRGMYPWPCAYCYLKNERIKITKVRASRGSGMPGRIEQAGEELVIGTGEGFITIIELQPEGKRLMAARDFLRGKPLQEGTFFDEP
jgi:methionyl-tRNA formyltransferase